MNSLPSIRQMIKLIIVLILALIAISVVLEIVKALFPIAIIAGLVLGAYYFYQKMQDGEKAKNNF